MAKALKKQVKSLQAEYDAFLLPKKYGDTYQLKIDKTNHTLSLWIDAGKLPKEIENKLYELLLKTESKDCYLLIFYTYF